MSRRRFEQIRRDFLDIIPQMNEDFILFMHYMENAYFAYLNILPVKEDTPGRLLTFLNYCFSNHDAVWENASYFHGSHGDINQQFSFYRQNTRICGAALLDADCRYILICQGFWSDTWTVPGGKLCSDYELEYACALREVHEETGYQLTLQKFHTPLHFFRDCRSTIFIETGVPINTRFNPTVPYEISKIM